MTEREKLMKQLQMYDFAVIEAGLFLDTHPNDKEALNYFNKVRKLAENAREDYEKKYGPNLMTSTEGRTNWEWALKPGPWEVEA